MLSSVSDKLKINKNVLFNIEFNPFSSTKVRPVVYFADLSTKSSGSVCDFPGVARASFFKGTDGLHSK